MKPQRKSFFKRKDVRGIRCWRIGHIRFIKLLQNGNFVYCSYANKHRWYVKCWCKQRSIYII